MTEENPDTSPSRSPLPYIIIAILVVILIAGLFIWNSQQQEKTPPQVRDVIPVKVKEPEPQQPVMQVEPEPEEPAEALPEVNTEESMVPEPEPVKPVDTSDSAIKQQITATSDYEALAQVLVNDDLLERFVVFTDNLANRQIASGHRLLKRPQQKFKVYQQADRWWIDASSFKRYSLYTDIFTSMDSEQLVKLFERYMPAMQNKYMEVGSTQQPFDMIVDEAIEHLLNTPEVPTPIEVTTDSVMYKYVDPRLEELSPVQKQLLRTGPENMRQIKTKLREIKALLDAQ
ncbi:DUF3014 domain-containing protein [Neptunicella marina]|uniref:DUF3014 domain-containing protein n=1 Tax=Neptunicella marina TaxID=2125989 RepID=A0A8J6M5H3_9ALTE|nr:DUF3014 domain-containing protein [Neptunicella marina]MBC3766521.1 DUF3014 domain-containing protein [Neptunicella marina]